MIALIAFLAIVFLLCAATVWGAIYPDIVEHRARKKAAVRGGVKPASWRGRKWR